MVDAFEGNLSFEALRTSSEGWTISFKLQCASYIRLPVSPLLVVLVSIRVCKTQSHSYNYT